MANTRPSSAKSRVRQAGAAPDHLPLRAPAAPPHIEAMMAAECLHDRTPATRAGRPGAPAKLKMLGVELTLAEHAPDAPLYFGAGVGAAAVALGAGPVPTTLLALGGATLVRLLQS